MAYGIVANVMWDRVLRMGAKVYLLGYHGDFESVYVSGRSKGGRRIRKYVPMKRLRSFRAAWLPPHITGWLQFAERAPAETLAQQLVAFWEGVRFLTTEGTVLQEGISVGEAFHRAGQRG